MEILRKARKPYTCECCNLPINIGDTYLYIKKRNPVYEMSEDPEGDGPQIGIDYQTVRVHPDFNRCWMSEDCKNDKHKFEDLFDVIGDNPGLWCSECGAFQPKVLENG